MKLFGQLVRTVVNTALLPVAVVKDIMRLRDQLALQVSQAQALAAEMRQDANDILTMASDGNALTAAILMLTWADRLAPPDGQAPR